MDKEDLMEELEDLRAFRNIIWPQYEKELVMWRKRFLESCPEFIRNQPGTNKYFLLASPDHILKNGPLECVKDICKIFLQGMHENKST